MSIKRFKAVADTVITNAFEANLTSRGTGANMGAADILESFVIHGQANSIVNAVNAEQARTLIKFSTTEISSQRSSGALPASGGVKFYLKLFNAPHGDTLPESFSLEVSRITAAWDEGRGLDMDEYTDLGAASWAKRTTGNDWTLAGGDYNTPTVTATFAKGTEDIELDITALVEQWIDGTYENHGLIIKNTTAAIDGDEGSLYTKKFFGRGSEFFFKTPHIEARWDSARQDNRANFILSSSLAPAADNINTIYLYNRIRGELSDIPGLSGHSMNVSFYSASLDGVPAGSPISIVLANGSTATQVTAIRATEGGSALSGIYTASFGTTNTASTLYDVWSTGSGETLVNFHTGSISTTPQAATTLDSTISYASDITNLRSSYTTDEVPRFRLFVRNRDWSPTIYTVANTETKTTIIDKAFYRVFRIIDDACVIPFGTGSDAQTKMSYDNDGNYFDLDLSLFESGYSYGIRLAYYLQGQYKEQSELFKFRVQD